MNAGEPAQTDLDPALEQLMSQMDEALFEGRPTDDFEREIAERFGESPSRIVSTLKALHSARAASLSSVGSDCKEAPFAGTHATSGEATWVHGSGGISQTQFGPFEILERLGSGGAGTVFRARDSRLGRMIALKVARAEALFSGEAKQRFVREAQTLATLRHANIIPIYEFGESGGLPYIVEELCDGPNLAIWLRRKAEAGQKVPIRTAARWTQVLAEAVAHAHRSGIVHRDLKPSNVLLGPATATSRAVANARPVADESDPDNFVLRVSDFGIAKLFESEEQVTASQAVLGTAAYMAPEQAEGRSREVGPPADVYSLGVILYELLTGRRPIEGRSEVDTLRRVLTEEPLPPTELRRDVPRDLEAICMKCLEKDFCARYPSAAELAEDLTRFLEGEPVHARRLSPVVRAMRRLRKPRVASTLTIGALLALALIVAIRGMLLQGGKGELTASIAPLEAERALVSRSAYSEDIQHSDLLLHRVDPNVSARQATAEEARQILANYIPKGDARDQRGFEWHYLWKITHPRTSSLTFPVVRTNSAHNAPVYSVCFSPDGRSLAAASADGTATVWDVETGKPRFTLVGHTNEVNCLAFSPSGQTLATASEDGTVRRWDAETGAYRETIWKYTAEICSLAFNPTNNHLACAAYDGTLTVWDCATLKPIVTKSQTKKIENVAFSSDGKMMAAAGADDRVRVWEASGAFNPIAEFEVPEPSEVCFSHDQQLLGVGHSSGARIYRIGTRELLTQIPVKSRHIRSVLFTPDDSAILVAGDSSALVDLTTGETGDPFKAAEGHWCASLSPNGLLAATADANGQVTLWDCAALRNPQRSQLPLPQWCPAAYLAFSPDGRRIAMAANVAPEKEGLDKAEIAVWDISSFPHRRLSQVSPEVRWQVQGIAFAPDGDAIAYSERRLPNGPERIRIVDASTGAQRREIAGDATALDYLLFSSGGSWLVSQERFASPPEVRLIFRAANNGQIAQTIPVVSPSAPFAISPNENLFATCGTNRSSNVDLLELQSAANSLPPVQLGGFGEAIHSLVFSRDGNLLIGRGGGGYIVVLSREKGGVLRQFTVPGVSSIAGYAVALSSDGRSLALGSKAGIVLADFESGRVLCTLAFSTEMQEVKSVAFSSDGRTIAANAISTQGQCGIHLWQVDESRIAPAQSASAER
jgi:eukaryotic-like serine/threonine-protein kinase